MKEKLAEKLINNLDVKILSLILAFFLWIIVMNISDPVEEREFKDIPVEVINEDAIADVDKVYTIASGSTVDITVEGPQSIVRELSASDFTAIADLAKTSDVGAVIIDVRAPSQYEDKLTLTTGKRNDEVMIIALEDKKTYSYRVNVRTVDAPLTGYYVMPEYGAEVKMVEVSGAESKVDDIKEVIAEVSVNGKSAPFTTTAQLKAYNSYGYEVDGIEFAKSEVEVSITVVPTKEVTVNVVPKGDAAYGYMVGSIKNDPEVITIAGEMAALNEYSSFRPSFNVAGQSGDPDNHILEAEIDLETEYGAELAEKGIVFVEDNTKVSVQVTFQSNGKQKVWLMKRDIELRNVPEGLIAEIDMEGGYTKMVEVVGPAGTENLLASDIRAYLDLSKGVYEAGNTYQVEIHINPVVSGVKKTGSFTIAVTFSAAEIVQDPGVVFDAGMEG